MTVSCRDVDHTLNDLELKPGDDESLVCYKIYRRKLQYFLQVNNSLIYEINGFCVSSVSINSSICVSVSIFHIPFHPPIDCVNMRVFMRLCSIRLYSCVVLVVLQTSLDYHPDRLLKFLPPQFLHELALLLSRQTRHEEVNMNMNMNMKLLVPKRQVMMIQLQHPSPWSHIRKRHISSTESFEPIFGRCSLSDLRLPLNLSFVYILMKLTCHKVLQIYVHQLKSLPLAEGYCGRVYATAMANATSAGNRHGGRAGPSSGSAWGDAGPGDDADEALSVYLCLLKVRPCSRPPTGA